MRDLATITDIIRQSVSAVEAGRELGLRPDRHGRCACPVHNGKDRNCKLYEGFIASYVRLMRMSSGLCDPFRAVRFCKP